MNTEDLKERIKPKFDNPPLVEVVAGIQFEHLSTTVQTLDFADIWTSFGKNKFPTYREMPPLENTGTIEFSNLPRMRRYWFESEKKDALLQLQRDRFIYNWRRPPENMDKINCYPEYENVVKKDFFNYYKKFQTVLSDKNIDIVQPSSMELSYVNLIDIPEKGISDIHHIFKDIAWNAKKRILPVPENIHHHLFFNVPDRPLKLISSLTTQQRTHDGKMVFQYELSVRGPVNNPSSTDMLEWFNDARLWINHGFVDTTHPDMHKIWGRTA